MKLSLTQLGPCAWEYACWILGGLMLLFSLPATSSAQQATNFIDDTKIQDKLYSKGFDLLQKKHVSAKKLIDQLKTAPKTYSLDVKARDSQAEEAIKISQNYNSTVIVGWLYSSGDGRTLLSTAGGVVVDSDGLVLTNHHVLMLHQKKAQNFFVMTHDGQVFPVTTVLAADKAKDLALIRVAAKELEPAVFAKQPSVPNSEIYLIHHPHNRFYSTDRGTVSRYSTKVGKDNTRGNWMEINAIFSYGSSGCGAFNEQGELAGLVSRKEIVRKRYPNNVSEVELVVRQCVPQASIVEFLSDQREKK